MFTQFDIGIFPMLSVLHKIALLHKKGRGCTKKPEWQVEWAVTLANRGNFTRYYGFPPISTLILAALLSCHPAVPGYAGLTLNWNGPSLSSPLAGNSVNRTGSVVGGGPFMDPRNSSSYNSEFNSAAAALSLGIAPTLVNTENSGSETDPTVSGVTSHILTFHLHNQTRESAMVDANPCASELSSQMIMSTSSGANDLNFATRRGFGAKKRGIDIANIASIWARCASIVFSDQFPKSAAYFSHFAVLSFCASNSFSSSTIRPLASAICTWPSSVCFLAVSASLFACDDSSFKLAISLPVIWDVLTSPRSSNAKPIINVNVDSFAKDFLFFGQFPNGLKSAIYSPAHPATTTAVAAYSSFLQNESDDQNLSANQNNATASAQTGSNLASQDCDNGPLIVCLIAIAFVAISKILKWIWTGRL